MRTDREDAIVLFDYLDTFIARVELYDLSNKMIEMLDEQKYSPQLKRIVTELLKQADVEFNP